MADWTPLTPEELEKRFKAEEEATRAERPPDGTGLQEAQGSRGAESQSKARRMAWAVEIAVMLMLLGGAQASGVLNGMFVSRTCGASAAQFARDNGQRPILLELKNCTIEKRGVR